MWCSRSTSSRLAISFPLTCSGHMCFLIRRSRNNPFATALAAHRLGQDFKRRWQIVMRYDSARLGWLWLKGLTVLGFLQFPELARKLRRHRKRPTFDCFDVGPRISEHLPQSRCAQFIFISPVLHRATTQHSDQDTLSLNLQGLPRFPNRVLLTSQPTR